MSTGSAPLSREDRGGHSWGVFNVEDLVIHE